MRRSELVGQKFGKLLVLSFAEIRKGHSYWNIRCDCGTEKVVLGYHLTRKNIKSCGCGIAKGNGHSSFRGSGRVSMTYFSSIKRGADGGKGRVAKEFSVTIDYLSELFDKQDGKCALSGLDLDFITKKETASLDRIDSSIGYIEGNLQWVHKDINMMKRAYDQDYFIELCRKIADHSKR